MSSFGFVQESRNNLTNNLKQSKGRGNRNQKRKKADYKKAILESTYKFFNPDGEKLAKGQNRLRRGRVLDRDTLNAMVLLILVLLIWLLR